MGAAISAPAASAAASGGHLDAMTEDEQLELALRLSMEQSAAAAAAEPMEVTPSASAPVAEASAVDAAELERLVAMLPGADVNDPEIQKAIKASSKAVRMKRKSL